MQAFLADTPINGPASYLLACAHLRDGRTREAAREFGAAYHADCNLESAALLTFACLKSREGPDTDITEQIEKTWHEMKRPDLLEHWEDRAMLLTLSTLSLDAAQHKAPGKFLGLCLDALKKCEPNQARSGPLASSSDSRDPFR